MFLEDIARDYAKEFSDIDQLNLPSLSIIDAHDKAFRDLFDDDEWKQIVDESPPIPQLPCSLADHITSYTKVTPFLRHPSAVLDANSNSALPQMTV